MEEGRGGSAGCGRKEAGRGVLFCSDCIPTHRLSLNASSVHSHLASPCSNPQ
jgi:hypothetical protein